MVYKYLLYTKYVVSILLIISRLYLIIYQQTRESIIEFFCIWPIAWSVTPRFVFSVCIVADDRPGVAFTNVHSFVFPVVGIAPYGAHLRVGFWPHAGSWRSQFEV